ncbi:MAG: ShlB/FhaC/HecB family hemolysin secretion/activation protein [Bacteroidota bacterium]
MLRILFLFWALAQVPAMVVGQSALRLETLLPGSKWEVVPKRFADSTAVVTYLADWLADQQAKAYWEASVDTLVQVSPSKFRAQLHRGPQYNWSQLAPPQISPYPSRLLKKSGYRPRRYQAGRRFSPEQWTALRDSLLVNAADAGYPFAAVGLDSIKWASPGALSARIGYQPGPLVRIGEVRIPDGVKIRPVFLQRYLGLRTGEVYRGSRVRRINQRLQQLPYVSVKGSPKITFLDSLAFFDLPLERRAASRFDFVIGVLPQGGQDGNLLITGELNGELYNGFGQGERIAARFEQLQPQTQELAVALEYPFLFNLPFGFEGELDLYRRDSSFLNLNWRLAATYLREGNDRLSFFWENRRTIVPGQQAQEPGQTTLNLPDTLGVSRSFFGLQARRVRTDRRFAPRSGYAFDLSAAAGFRRLLDVTPSDSLSVNGTQLKVTGSLETYFDPLTGIVFYLGLHGAGLFSGDAVLPNEQFRLGGARLLRGFNEQSVFARDYLISTLELRLLLGGNAFLYTFLDAGRVNRRNTAQPDLAIDYPVGFGVGVNFDTRAGVFGLSLALGRSNEIPFDLGEPKVHLGYVSVF